jgi:hypothetical protein
VLPIRIFFSFFLSAHDDHTSGRRGGGAAAPPAAVIIFLVPRYRIFCCSFNSSTSTLGKQV